MKTIPQNTILKSKGLGDTIGDIVSSFNLDLSSNYGAIRTNRMKSISVDNNNKLGKPIAFANYLNLYWALDANTVWKGGDQPSNQFTDFDSFNTMTGLQEGNSDMKVFNGGLYWTGGTKVWATTNGTSFTDVITTGLTNNTPHLLEVLTDKLYVTDNYHKVWSISTSNVLTNTGATTIDLLLDSSWTITSLKSAGGLLWISCLNIYNGKGKVYSWDGNATIPNSMFDLPSGIVSSTVLDNVLYIFDTQGVLKRYAGNAFVEVARLPKDNLNFFEGASLLNNSRFVHPNGMQVSDNGTILIHISNSISGFTYDNDIPSGIWEYDVNVGLYHKYSLSISPSDGVTYNDYGQQRVSSPGALYFAKPVAANATDNGILLAGAKYYTNAGSTAYKIFCDDTLDTTQKWGYFITSKIFTNIQEQWQKVYAIYKKFTNSNSKIVVKYRTEEDTPTETTITWVDTDRFTSSVSLSAYEVGDEVQVVQGAGSGLSAHIKEIVGSTYILDEIYPTIVIGLTSKALVSKWKKAGTEITATDNKQFKELTLSLKNTSPFIQFKVCMRFNTKDELNKLQIISQSQVKE